MDNVVFNPYQYSDKGDYINNLDVKKPVSSMTLKEALKIVIGQARASDFHDEVVEHACRIVETDLLKETE